MKVRNIRTIAMLALLAGGVSLTTGCAVQHPLPDATAREALFDRFAAGEVELQCRFDCSYTYEENASYIAQLYNNKMWRELAVLISHIGYRQNLTWYMLGVSADGLGYRDAAARYYEKALLERNQCGIWEDYRREKRDSCGGLKVNVEAQRRREAILSPGNAGLDKDKSYLRPDPKPAKNRPAPDTASSTVEYPKLDPGRLKGHPNPNALALIIGIDRYETAPTAEFGENDARDFYDYAINALGVKPTNIKLLSGQKARRLDIEKAVFTWLKPSIVKGQTEVYIYFSGHGLASSDGTDLFLLPYDGDGALLARSAVRRKEIIQAVTEAGARSTTIFTDTCYSGGTRTGETLIAGARPIAVVAKESDVPQNVTILAASGADQFSNSLPPARHGLFSYLLMKGLEGDADVDHDRQITADELQAYLQERVPREAAKLGRPQTPQLIGDGSRVVTRY
jgi:hypothetical protein